MASSASAYFLRYLKIAPLSHALWRSVEAQELAKYPLKKPVLDIGCGFGEFGGIFFSSQVEVGLDINEQEILKAAATGKYKKTITADARNLPFKNNTFGSVISVSTLEHIPNNAKVFKEAFRVLKPGGAFIFTVPTQKLFDGLLVVKILNALGLKSLSYIYFRVLNKAFKHVFLPPEKTWLELSKKAGFQIEEVHGTIPQPTLYAWELGIPFAFPSQLIRILTGKRLLIAAKLKTKLFKPFIALVKTDPDFRANIIVIARKPKK